MNSYICLDIEATGLSPRNDRIIEIGAIKIIDGVEAQTFSTFVNPGRRLDERIVQLTGITDNDLKDAPYINDIIADLVDFTEELPLLGHHIISDFAIIKQSAVNNKIEFEKEALDTLKISRACLPELESKRLKDVCNHYGIELNAHRAANDARATHELFKCLKADFFSKYPDLFVPNKLNHKVKKEGPIRQSQMERIKALTLRYNIDCPYDVEHMTMNEAGRYIDILLAQYGK